MDRAAAVNALRQTKVFRNTSYRLLADLVEKAEAETGSTAAKRSGDAAVVLVVDGEVSVTEPNTPRARVTAGQVYWPEEPDLLNLSASRKKEARKRGEPPPRPRHVEPKNGAQFVKLSRDFLINAHKASFSLFTSLDFSDWDDYQKLAKAPTTDIPLHLIWMCKAPDFDAPLEAMTQLLAASVARDFDEPAAILQSKDGQLDLRLWRDERFDRVPLEKGKVAVETLNRVLKGQQLSMCHVFVVGPSTPDDIPVELARLEFQRIVYVTPDVPAVDVPERLEKTLHSEARNGRNPAAPYFSSFVPSLVATGQSRPQSKTFSEPLVFDGNGPDGPKRAAERRLRRDLCRIPFDLGQLEKLWEKANEPGEAKKRNGESEDETIGNESEAAEDEADAAKKITVETFAEYVLEMPDSKYDEIARRWARAITNRSVGLAVSGGGATSYRMVALVEMLEKENVPIDVLGGISGGTLVGAYYCRNGKAGLEQCVENGLRFQAVLGLSVVDSRVIRAQVDRDLGGGNLGDVDIRLVPIATALRDRESPEAHAICGGTLGEAVLASGAAPGLFSPVDRSQDGSSKKTRYTDGVASRLIPARAIVDYGADLVIAFNTVPAPKRRNPFDRWLLGRLLYDWTPASRLIDFGVSFMFFLEQCSSEVEEDAHVFIPTELQEEPLFEALLFAKAAAIVEAARNDNALRARAAECGRRWKEFCQSPAVP